MRHIYHNIKADFIRLGRRIPAVLYTALTEGMDTKNSRIAVLVMHSDEDYLTCPTGPELAKRGFTVLCANVIGKEGIIFSQNEKLRCVHAAVSYLKGLHGIDKVVLMGHSGGATLMTAYQAIAEEGPEVFQGAEMLSPYPNNERLTRADGIMLLDANWGNAVMQLFSLDPALRTEENGRDIDPELNLFDPENGFNKQGSSYSREFIRKFQLAQSARNMRILNSALERSRLIDEGRGNYRDDEPLVIPGAAQSFFNNKLYAQDIRLMSRTKKTHALIHCDGRVTEELVYSVRKPENDHSFTDDYTEGARYLTVKTYLSSYAIRTEEDFGYDESSVWGIDWKSSYASPVGNIEHIHVPTLVMGMTGGWEYLASETLYEKSPARDKHIAFVEGASHKFEPARHYESYPGQFGDTMKLLHDYVAEWLSEGRF